MEVDTMGCDVSALFVQPQRAFEKLLTILASCGLETSPKLHLSGPIYLLIKANKSGKNEWTCLNLYPQKP